MLVVLNFGYTSVNVFTQQIEYIILLLFVNIGKPNIWSSEIQILYIANLITYTERA